MQIQTNPNNISPPENLNALALRGANLHRNNDGKHEICFGI